MKPAHCQSKGNEKMHDSNEGIFNAFYNGYIYIYIYIYIYLVTANTLEVKSAVTSTLSCSYRTRKSVHLTVPLQHMYRYWLWTYRNTY